MIRFTFNNTNQTTLEALRARSGRLVARLVRKMDYLMLRLQSKIVVEKLQGEVLHHRSGVLSGSVTVVPASVEGTNIVGAVTGASGPAWYGQVHERGGERAYTIVPVAKEALRFMVGGKEVFAKSVIHPPLPKRPFMGSSLEEMGGEIIEGLQEGVNEVLAEPV